ncbi:MAG: tetratricopeptide repeat protein [Methanomassiliicoccaceae archaeon]|nr:tetratricopeptide repeat protein [Methanomassiliicoccaceae archaeon]
MTDVMDKVAALLCGYASKKIDGSYISAFGRRIKRSQEWTSDDDVRSSLSDLRISDDALKAFSSEKNRRLICACIFAKDIGPSKHVDPAYMESADDKEKVRNEIREFILTVHGRIWSDSTVAAIMGRREVQNTVRKDLEKVMAELKAVRDSQYGQGDDTDIIVTSYPSASPAFTGRDMDLFELSLLVEKNDTVFVYGPDGIGKTEMCRKFAEAWACKGPVAWLGYDGDLRSTIVWHLKVNGMNENEILDEEMLFWSKLSILANDPGALLIIDDVAVDDKHLKTVSKYGFRKIFISSDKGRMNGYANIELGPLSENDSYEMLMRSLNEDKKEWAAARERDIRNLLRSVRHHALTISMMARSINAGGRSEELTEVLPADADGRIRELLEMSPLSDREKEVLTILSMLPGSGMPLRRFTSFSGTDDKETDTIIRSLEVKGWIDVTRTEGSGDEVISAHRMVLRIMKERFGPKENDCGMFLASLERFFDLGRVFNNWTEKMDLLPVLISATDTASESPYAPVLYSLSGRYLCGSGNYDAALEHYFKALELKERIFGADHPGLAPTYTGLGNVYSDKGEYDKAVECYVKALRLSGRMVGIDDPNIAATYNNVGISYSERREYDKALIYYEKALNIRERLLGEDHEDTATTCNNIGNAYSDKGEQDRSLEYYFRALAIREKVFGEDHYYTAVTHSNVGVAYLRMKEYDKALENTVKAMDIMRRAAGQDHPDTVAMYEVIAYIQEMTGVEDTYAEYRPKANDDWNFMYM